MIHHRLEIKVSQLEQDLQDNNMKHNLSKLTESYKKYEDSINETHRHVSGVDSEEEVKDNIELP